MRPESRQALVRQPGFGRRLRGLRLSRGLTQRALAGEAVTPSYVSLVEAGRRVPTLDVVVHLARGLAVPVNQLLEGGDVAALDRDEQLDVAALLTEAAARDSMEFNEHERAVQTLRVALERARATNQPMRVLELGLQLQQAYAATGAHRERVALLEELLELPPSRDSPELEVMIRSDLAGALRESGRVTEAWQVAGTALEQIGGTGLEGTVWHVKLLGVAVSIMVECHTLEGLESRVDQLLAVAGGFDGSSVQGRAHWVASRAHALLGDGVAAKQHLVDAQRLLSPPTMPLRDWLRFCVSSGSVLLDIDAGLDQVRLWLDRADRAAQALGNPAMGTWVAMLAARYEYACGRPEQCLTTLDPLLQSQGAASLTDTEVLELRLLQGRALADLHRHKPAEQTLRQVAAQAEALGRLDLALQAWHELDHMRGNAGRAANTT